MRARNSDWRRQILVSAHSFVKQSYAICPASLPAQGRGRDNKQEGDKI